MKNTLRSATLKRTIISIGLSVLVLSGLLSMLALLSFDLSDLNQIQLEQITDTTMQAKVVEQQTQFNKFISNFNKDFKNYATYIQRLKIFQSN